MVIFLKNYKRWIINVGEHYRNCVWIFQENFMNRIKWNWISFPFFFSCIEKKFEFLRLGENYRNKWSNFFFLFLFSFYICCCSKEILKIVTIYSRCDTAITRITKGGDSPGTEKRDSCENWCHISLASIHKNFFTRSNAFVFDIITNWIIFPKREKILLNI